MAVSQQCYRCVPRSGEHGHNWRGGVQPCPDCGGKKTREAKRCRACSHKASVKYDDLAHLDARERQRAFRKTPQGQAHVRSMNLKRFGLTLEEYEVMLAAQGGVCAACGGAETSASGGVAVNSLSVDHDHSCCEGQRSCGKCVRGLLCNRCNRALGMLGDSTERLEALLSYMERAKEVMPR